MEKSIFKGKPQHKSFDKKMAYCPCQFKRTKDSVWEKGLAILKYENIGISDVECILDMDNKLVTDTVFNYNLEFLWCELKQGHYII